MNAILSSLEKLGRDDSACDAEAVLTSIHNLCFEQKYEKYNFYFFFHYNFFLSEKFQFFEVKSPIYLNRRVFVMVNGPCLEIDHMITHL